MLFGIICFISLNSLSGVERMNIVKAVRLVQRQDQEMKETNEKRVMSRVSVSEGMKWNERNEPVLILPMVGYGVYTTPGLRA